MQLQSYFALENMSCIKIAILIWQRTDIRNKIQDFFLNNDTSEDLDEWVALMDSISEDTISRFPLPWKLKHNLHRTLLLLGLKIRHWIIYLKVNLYGSYAHQEFVFIEGIHWTTYGTIDTSKTILTIIDRIIRERQGVSARNLYWIASKHCLGEHLMKMMESSPWCDELNKIVRNHRYDNNLLVMYWQNWYLEKGNMPQVTDLRERLMEQLRCQERLSLEELFTRYSIQRGSFHAVKYFWKKLDRSEQQRILKFFGTRFRFKRTGEWRYLPENEAEVCLFLLGKMTDKQEMTMTWDTKLHILVQIISQWPYQELFVLLVEKWIRPEIAKSSEEAVYTKLQELLLSVISFSDKRQLIFTEREILVKIFAQFWVNVPIESRRFLCCRENWFKHLDCREGREIVKCIFFDEDSKNIFIENLSQWCSDRVTSDGHSAIDAYLCNLIGTDEKAMLRVKEEIDIKDYCFQLLESVTDKYDSFTDLDNVLAWKFSSPGAVTLYKRNLVYENPCNVKNLFLNIWSNQKLGTFFSRRSHERLCAKVIEYCLECDSEETVNKYKRDVLVKEGLAVSIYRTLSENRKVSAERIQSFIDWSLMTKLNTGQL